MPLKVKRHKRSKIPSHRNTKRLRRKQNNPSHPKSEIDIVRNSWDHKKSARKNLKDMGLSYDPNVTVSRAIKHPGQEMNPKSRGPKSEIAKLLEQDAKTPRVKKFKFPKPQAIYFTYLVKKYGDNYKEMAKDPKNVYQETWKKIRSRIKQFKTLEQYKKFMSGQI